MLLHSDSKEAFCILFVTFIKTRLLSNFWVTLAGTPKVAFESLFCVFEFSGAWGPAGEMAGHDAISNRSVLFGDISNCNDRAAEFVCHDLGACEIAFVRHIPLATYARTHNLYLRVLCATFFLSKNSRVLIG